MSAHTDSIQSDGNEKESQIKELAHRYWDPSTDYVE